jgi:hypothetical protein
MPGGYVVRDANGQALLFVYSRDSDAEARQSEGAHKGRGAADRCQHRAAAGATRQGGSGVTPKIESRRGILSEPPDHPRHNNRTDQQPGHQRKKRYHRSYEDYVGRPHHNSSAALEPRSIPRLPAANILRRPRPPGKWWGRDQHQGRKTGRRPGLAEDQEPGQPSDDQGAGSGVVTIARQRPADRRKLIHSKLGDWMYCALPPFARGSHSSRRFRAFCVSRWDQVFPRQLCERHRHDRANAPDREKASWSSPNISDRPPA